MQLYIGLAIQTIIIGMYVLNTEGPAVWIVRLLQTPAMTIAA